MSTGPNLSKELDDQWQRLNSLFPNTYTVLAAEVEGKDGKYTVQFFAYICTSGFQTERCNTPKEAVDAAERMLNK